MGAARREYDPVPMRRVPACPTCKAKATALIEIGTQCTRWDVREDGKRDGEGYHSSGDFLRVEAECARGHRWRLRGVQQVTDLDTKPTPRRRKEGR